MDTRSILLSSAPGALAVAVSGLRVVRPGSVAPVAAGSLSLTLLSWLGLAWLLPASAGLEALRSLASPGLAPLVRS